MDKDDEQVREVFARFGLAIYTAQVLEEAIVNLMVASRLPQRSTVTVREIDELISGQHKKTLGLLIRDLDQDTASGDWGERLASALQIRNTLAHGYFHKHAVAFTRHSGRVGMIAELETLQEELENACTSVEEITHERARLHGVTREDIASEMARLLSE